MTGHTVGFEVIDGEHRIQVGPIDAMHDAVRQGREGSEIDEILDRMVGAMDELLGRHLAGRGIGA